jgi:transcriptional regulator GlxA family with amidase domain
MTAVANTGVVRSVVVLGYPGVQALDLVGPFEVFTGATIYLASQGRVNEGYTVRIVSQNGEPATTLTGLALVAEPLPDPRVPIDTLVLPGGIGVDEARRNADTVGWIQIASEHARRVVSVCTGSFLAAQAGLVDGCVATTHWAFAGQMANEFPSVIVDPEPIFVRSSRTTTAPRPRRPSPAGWCSTCGGPGDRRNSPRRCGCRVPSAPRSARCRRPSNPNPVARTAFRS